VCLGGGGRGGIRWCWVGRTAGLSYRACKYAVSSGLVPGAWDRSQHEAQWRIQSGLSSGAGPRGAVSEVVWQVRAEALCARVHAGLLCQSGLCLFIASHRGWRSALGQQQAAGGCFCPNGCVFDQCMHCEVQGQSKRLFIVLLRRCWRRGYWADACCHVILYESASWAFACLCFCNDVLRYCLSTTAGGVLPSPHAIGLARAAAWRHRHAAGAFPAAVRGSKPNSRLADTGVDRGSLCLLDNKHRVGPRGGYEWLSNT